MSCFTATSRCVLSHKDLSGILNTTRSHRLRVAHSLDLEAWNICMLRCNVTSRRQFSHLSCRYLYKNQITSIAGNAFSGLGSLAKLYVTTRICVSSVILKIVLAQEPGLQSNHIGFQWRILRTWKTGRIVCNDSLSYHGASLYTLFVQVPLRQPNHIDCQWCIYWAWKPDFAVCYQAICFSLLNYMHIIHRYIETSPATKAPFNMLAGTLLTELYVAFHTLTDRL
jgi:hypothetical protein